MEKSRSRQDRRPNDPRKAEEWDVAKRKNEMIEADQASASLRNEADRKRRAKQIAEGQESVEKRLSSDEARRQKRKEQRDKERADYLKTPLNQYEMDELGNLELAVNKMSGSVPIPVMRRLADLRIRSKVEEEEGDENADLSGLKVTQLKAMAKNAGIKGADQMKKN